MYNWSDLGCRCKMDDCGPVGGCQEFNIMQVDVEMANTLISVIKFGSVRNGSFAYLEEEKHGNKWLIYLENQNMTLNTCLKGYEEESFIVWLATLSSFTDQ